MINPHPFFFFKVIYSFLSLVRFLSYTHFRFVLGICQVGHPLHLKQDKNYARQCWKLDRLFESPPVCICGRKKISSFSHRSHLTGTLSTKAWHRLGYTGYTCYMATNSTVQHAWNHVLGTYAWRMSMEFISILRFGKRNNLSWRMSSHKVFKICTCNCSGISNHAHTQKKMYLIIWYSRNVIFFFYIHKKEPT